MLETNQIRARLSNALKGYESLSDFAEWLSIESSSLRFKDNVLIDLIDSILSPLQVYFDGLIDNDSLKNELLQFLSDRDEVQELNLRFTFDDALDQSVKPDDLKPARNAQVQFAVASFVA